MLIWLNIYFVIYTFLLIILHWVLNVNIITKSSLKSLVFSHYYILKYSKIKYFYLWTLLSLAGLPPFLLFFVKANYILSFIGSVPIYLILIIFLSYFINMLFYTQFYLYKNTMFDDISYTHIKSKKLSIVTVCQVLYLLLIITMGFIFCPDIYYISILVFA